MQATELFGHPTFTIDETNGIGQYIRVKLKTGLTIEIAGAGESGIGHVRSGQLDGETVAVRLHNDPGKHLIVLGADVTDISTLYPIAAGKYDDTGTGTAVYTALEANTEGTGAIIAAILDPVVSTTAATVSIADAGAFTTATTVEAVTQELLQDAISVQHCIIPVIVTGEDGTVLTKYATGGATPGYQQLANKEVVLSWDGNGTHTGVALQFFIGDVRLDDSADVVLHYLARMSGATDTPVILTECFFNKGDTDCAGTDDEVDGGVTLTEFTVTIASADVPASPSHLTIIIQPTNGEMTTDELYIQGMWLEVTSKVRAS